LHHEPESVPFDTADIPSSVNGQDGDVLGDFSVEEIHCVGFNLLPCCRITVDSIRFYRYARIHRMDHRRRYRSVRAHKIFGCRTVPGGNRFGDRRGDFFCMCGTIRNRAIIVLNGVDVKQDGTNQISRPD